MLIPDDYKRDDGDGKKYGKVKGGRGVDRPPAPGRLAQTGTLEPYIVESTNRPLSADVSHNLAKPTLLFSAHEGLQPSSLTTTTTTIPRGLPFGGIKITLVSTSLTLCHSVAVDVRGTSYG